MTNQQIISMMQAPEQIDASSVADLQKLTEKYPAVGIFRMLLTKGLHNTGDISMDQSLRRTAVAIPDRGVLYSLLFRQKIKEIVAKIEDKFEAENREQTVVSESQTKDTNASEEETKEKTVEQKKVRDELEAEVLIHAIQSTIEIDVNEITKDETKETEAKPKEITQKTPKRFSDWLFTLQDIKNKKKDASLKTSSKELVNKFINTKRNKIDVSKEPLKPKELGRLSLIENEDFVTETLATVYAKQGQYHKAIKIYEQLGLKFPEKNVFFASRIRFLREKLEYEK